MPTDSQKVDRPDRTWGMSIYNAVGRTLARWGWRRRLDAADILDAAKRKTKLDNWGDDAFVEPLEILLDSLEQDAQLSPLGRTLMRHTCIHHVQNRLLVEQELTDEPSIDELPLRRPLFVVGLPRTGTTLLYNLLCQDPGCRPLLTWETFWPAAPQNKPLGKDRRAKRVRRAVQLMNHMAPRLRSVHALDADAPEECTWLMANTFTSSAFLLNGHAQRYADWLRDRTHDELRGPYDYYRRQLQVLAWHGDRAKHWMLKSPAHLGTLDVLLETFPDGNVIQTHRDPSKVVPSCCSLFAVVRAIYSDVIDRQQLGPELARSLSEMLDRALSAREQYSERVVDVRFADLMQNPFDTVRRVYDQLGYECSDEMQQRMRGWLAANPRNKHGKHRYNLDQFGLDTGQMNELFGSYCHRFGVTTAN